MCAAAGRRKNLDLQGDRKVKRQIRSMRGKLTCLGFVLGWIAFAVSGHSAEEEPAGKAQLQESLLWGDRWLVRDVTDYQRLSLGQCIRVALVNNLDIRSQRDALRSAEQDLRSARNFFDLKGTFSAEHRQDVYTPSVETGSVVVYDPVLQQYVTTAARTAVIDDDVTTLSLPVTQHIKTGGSITASPYLQESDYQRNQWASGINLGIRQPLLDGFGYDVSTADLRRTRLGLRRSEQSLDGAARVLVVQVVQDYYGILRTQKILEEQQEALQRAQSLLRAAQIRKEEGEVAELDVLRAELQVAQSENALIATRNTLRSRLTGFQLRLGVSPQQAVGIQAKEVEFEPTELHFDQLVDFALRHRHDLKNQELSLEQSRISLLTAKNRNLPNLDLTASYRFYDSHDDLDKVWDVDQGSVSLGVIFSMPLGDVSDDVLLQKARIGVDQAESALESLRREVISDIDNAVRQIETLENQIEVLQKNVEIAQEGFRLSQLSYEVGGLISSFDLAKAQEDLTSARTTYIAALIDYQIALAQLDLARGLDLVSLIEARAGTPLQ
ncbi:MAG TPA: TolC family protein [Firmicutes bacterium]|nr:TolC family protein [Bacillota bacterium]